MQTAWIKQSISARLFIIGFLVLVLLIPAFMVQSLIRERQDRRDGAVAEVNQKWGKAQAITGPILSVPYKYVSKDAANQVVSKIGYAHFLPEQLQINGEVSPEIRKRGIYEIVLYQSLFDVSGFFSPISIEDLKVPPGDFAWSDAFISIGITDMKGLNDLVVFEVNDQQIPVQPGIETDDVLSSGVSIPLDTVDTNEDLNFAFTLNLNGSESLSFAPIGKETIVNLTSQWPDPSFVGAFLPAQHETSEQGFDADWKILHLNRNFPQKWTGSNNQINASTFGVRLLVPVDEYQKNMRTAKYAFMFIGLTFLSFFMIELLNKKLIHPIQYLLIGFALLVFYTLLLSFSEQMVFKYAYLISSVGTIGLITSYTKGVLKDNLQTGIILLILILLYAYLYIVLQLQDLALMIGSIGLFIILSLVMYLTRKIDWFSTLQVPTATEKIPGTSGESRDTEAL
ncbi:MAG: cell envelope integrity protein CreD [Candidatus Marinimicrobia bacterium]|nr:cell envelope integrity protein CreD [Candidatus Neomarinimicrobiota bacterium]